MKKNGAVSSSVLGIIIFAAVFLLLSKAGCSSCSSCTMGCVACSAYSCSGSAGGRDGVTFSGCVTPYDNGGQGSSSGSTVNHSRGIYVNDNAEAVSDSAEQAIRQLGAQLESATGAQLALVVINNENYLGDDDLKNYTYKLFNDWGVGSKNNDGVLLVINVAACEAYTGNAWCIIGTGLEKLLPASDVGDILDAKVFPSLDEGNFSDAALNGYTALYEKLTAVLGG